jgi:hypothetical protein
MTTTPRRPSGPPGQLALALTADTCTICGTDVRLAAYWVEGQAYCCNECPFCHCMDGGLPALMLVRANGLLRCANDRLVAGLVVRDGVVVDAPPIARRWALGRQAVAVANEARRRGADVQWIPDPPTANVIPS